MVLPYSNMDYSVGASDFITNNLLDDTTAEIARATLGIGHIIPTTAEADAGKLLVVNSGGNGVQFATAFYEPFRVRYLLNAKLNGNEPLSNGGYVTIDGFVDGGGSTDFSDMASNGEWTCPETAIYKITFDAQALATNLRGTNIFVNILIGGATKKEAGYSPTGGQADDYGQFIVSSHVILNLSANDVLKIRVRGDFTGGSCSLRGDPNITFTNLIIERLIL